MGRDGDEEKRGGERIGRDVGEVRRDGDEVGRDGDDEKKEGGEKIGREEMGWKREREGRWKLLIFLLQKLMKMDH